MIFELSAGMGLLYFLCCAGVALVCWAENTKKKDSVNDIDYSPHS